jgi:hypothetical protein
METHFKSSKTSIGGLFRRLEVSIFVKIFEFYLVTQSLLMIQGAGHMT